MKTTRPRPYRALLVCAAFVVLSAATARASENAAIRLFDSPIKSDPVYRIGETVACTLPLPGTAALFGVDEIIPTAPVQFITNELFPPFRVFQVDDTCTLQFSWSTAFPGATCTGIAVEQNPVTYWGIDPAAQIAFEFNLGTGIPTGANVPLPPTPSAGPAVIDSNIPGRIFSYQDILQDQILSIDLNGGGAFVCSFANADNTGTGAFGNGIGDAVDPPTCFGTTLVHSSGRIDELQTVRVGQYDCTGNICPDTWAIGFFSTFINGIEEFAPVGPAAGLGNPCLAIIDNVTSTFAILCQPTGIADCQEIDPGTALLWVNGTQGGIDFALPIDVNSTLATAMQSPLISNGKYVFQLHAGTPDKSSVTPLFDLGDTCFDFLSGSATVVANNVGKTNLVGNSSYFGTPSPDPAKAPAFIGALTQAVIDQVNFPTGSKWTGQSIVVNGSASSGLGGSKTNALVFCYE